jgi:hypothetical protein
VLWSGLVSVLSNAQLSVLASALWSAQQSALASGLWNAQPSVLASALASGLWSAQLNAQQSVPWSAQQSGQASGPASAQQSGHLSQQASARWRRLAGRLSSAQVSGRGYARHAGLQALFLRPRRPWSLMLPHACQLLHRRAGSGACSRQGSRARR